MFDNLVESGSHKEDLSRKGSFIAVTALIYGVLLVGFFVAGILWYDAHLAEQELGIGDHRSARDRMRRALDEVTVTGIQTCWLRRSADSIRSRWTSRRIDRASSATSRPRSPVSRSPWP